MTRTREWPAGIICVFWTGMNVVDHLSQSHIERLHFRSGNGVSESRPPMGRPLASVERRFVLRTACRLTPMPPEPSYLSGLKSCFELS